MFPHEDIRREGDRTWTNKLLEALRVNDSEKELENISETINVLDDYRAEQPLLEIMESSDILSRRFAASKALIGTSAVLNGAGIRKWWGSGDEVLMRHALLSCRQSEEDIIIPVASNPSHALYAVAIAGLEFGFETPIYQNLVISALSHISPEARRNAAKGLLWCQPLSAQADLLKVSIDRDEDAATTAIETLAWYESQEVLKFTNQQSLSGIESRRKIFDSCFYWLSKAFEGELDNLKGLERQFLIDWMAPVMHLLKLEVGTTKVDACESKLESATKLLKRVSSVEEALSIFAKTKGKEPRWYPEVQQINWLNFSKADRKVLCEFFEQHLDPSVREVGCSIMMGFDDTYSLLRLLDDPCASVRNAALYNLTLVPPHPEARTKLLEFLGRLENSEAEMVSALDCLFLHSTKDEKFAEYLLAVANQAQFERVRLSAMSHLSSMNSLKHLQSLVNFVEEEPMLTWCVHEFLLKEKNVTLSEHEKRISELRIFDYLSLQVALAEYFSR